MHPSFISEPQLLREPHKEFGIWTFFLSEPNPFPELSSSFLVSPSPNPNFLAAAIVAGEAAKLLLLSPQQQQRQQLPSAAIASSGDDSDGSKLVRVKSYLVKKHHTKLVNICSLGHWGSLRKRWGAFRNLLFHNQNHRWKLGLS